MQGKLFEIPPIRIKRPTLETIDFTETYKKMAKDILEWLGDNSASIDEIVEDLTKNFSKHDLSNEDGYHLARKLEKDCMYDSDSELVQTMDCFAHYMRMACNEAERKWVTDCWITPKHSIGDSVEVEYRGKNYIGTILNIYTDKAEYVINVPELGHSSGSQGTQGVVEHFEEIEKDFFKNKEE